MVKRHCDICDAVITKYIKLNAKEYGGGKETVNKPAIFTLEICKECLKNIKVNITTERTETKTEFL